MASSNPKTPKVLKPDAKAALAAAVKSLGSQGKAVWRFASTARL
jgi:hypothetical protein